MSPVKTAIFASGTGSNFEAIADAKDLPCETVILVCDKEQAPVIEKAKKRGIHSFIFTPADYKDKASYEKDILAVLQEKEVEWIFLAGYMRLIGDTLLKTYDRKIINIHPSLLPNFPGKDAIGQALRAGADETGVTVHFVDEGMDTGPIIDQEKLPIFKHDTMETLKKRIQEVEHRLYPKTIKKIIKSED
jgi:phosphoribosylglycinamide formyltransferase-1